MFKFFHNNPKNIGVKGLGLVRNNANEVIIDEHTRSIQENLYRQNLELSVKNKTLSLLAKLYEISTETLEPKDLAKQVAFSVRTILNFKFVGIFLFSEKKDEFTPLSVSAADPVQKIKVETGCDLETMVLSDVSKSDFFKPIIVTRLPNQTEFIFKLWGSQISTEVAVKFHKEAHMRTALCYPLVIDKKVIGLFMVIISHSYDVFSEHERSSLEAAANVIALILDKAKLYQALEETNQKIEKANKQLKELDRLKSEFVSIATHQIRGPLTAIEGYASMMIEGDYGEMSEKLKDPINTIYHSSQTLVGIVEDFLNASQIDQGKMKYDFSTFDMCALVKEVVVEEKPILEKKGLTVSVFECFEQNNVSGDRDKIKQVIGNLIDNAIKYTPKGSITVTLKVESESKKVLIIIKDTGVGIRPETIPHLFKKFSRAKDASRVNIMGTGLGLYVAHEMIKAHNGKIWVESEGEGKGSTFFVEMALV
ncbi:MAG: GAF domain-containing sensor histidine kinase [Candidatus Taylorbacteria bacterium]|nr:GAF domain-containing sensor histidine kinase [Candidatus Taylorbacteria bacterium]